MKNLKVLKNNAKVEDKILKTIPETIITYCDRCGSELEITEEDTHIGWLGAKFIICLTGEVMTMPGLSKEPMALKIDIDENYNVYGLM